MAYKDTADFVEFIKDLSTRKEFCIRGNTLESKKDYSGFITTKPNLILPGLHLNGAQLFVQNFQNPNTKYNRLLIKWQTGVGKSIAAISIGLEFIRQFRARELLGESPTPTVYIISFTARDTIQEDMLSYPEFGYISYADKEKMRTLRAAAAAAGLGSQEARNYSGFMGALRRKITDKSRGGYFKFYGYKEFANHIFVVTRQGVHNEFDIQKLYDDNFEKNLQEAIKRGDVNVNTQLLNEIKHGLLIADEIHNAYNIMDANNYGITIQYVLDSLGDAAPRAVFMSATPMTGSAAEIVDLLNLLTPKSELPGGKSLVRSDFFIKTTSKVEEDNTATFTVSQLKPDALEQISKLAAGKVSFLLDSDVESYPRRIFEGEDIANIPYLKITKCEMSKFHADSLKAEQQVTPNLSAITYTLYDMAFPNPDSATIGLYKSGETVTKLLDAPSKWQTETGISINADASTFGSYIISGTFLRMPELAKYSAKYAAILEETIAAIKAGPGKIMIFHQRVRMSGVLLLQEIFRMNGFADELSTATDQTLCAICGQIRLSHFTLRTADGAAVHTYTPARFIVAHSDIDRATMMRSIANFNAKTNINGYEIRIIIGSRVIREGLNFRGVRHQFIASLPTDYPTLIQVFGRCVRKDSHSDLPEGDRNVKIKVFVSVGETSPELIRYINKGREYLIIQQVDRALNINAIDGFANIGRIRTVLGTTASIDAMPYTPALEVAASGATVAASGATVTKNSTFLAYGHGDREVATIVAICRVLFQVRTVWTSDDLYEAVQSNTVKGINYDSSLFSRENFAAAIVELQRLREISRAGKYFIAGATIDIESYMRQIQKSESIKIGVADYVKTIKADENWSYYLQSFEAKYLNERGSREKPFELLLIEFNSSFHFKLIRLLITKSSVTSNDKKIVDLYKKFNIVITARQAIAAHKQFKNIKKENSSIIGFVTADAVELLGEKSEWVNLPHATFNIGPRHKENNITVGYASNDATDILTGVTSKFKIRPPIQQIQGKHTDMRNLTRGAVCETRGRFELEEILQKLKSPRLRSAHGGADSPLHTNLQTVPQTSLTKSDDLPITSFITNTEDNSTAKDDIPEPQTERSATQLQPGESAPPERGGESAGPPSAEPPSAATERSAKHKSVSSPYYLCIELQARMLELEERARLDMMNGTRWVYLFNEKMPNLTL